VFTHFINAAAMSYHGMFTDLLKSQSILLTDLQTQELGVNKESESDKNEVSSEKASIIICLLPTP
jgi:hypothetical protein